MTKQTGEEKAKSKGLWLYPDENKALQDLAKRWKLKESRVVARLIRDANPDATGTDDVGASVSAIASGLERIEARLTRLEELLAAGCSLPGRDMPRLDEARAAKNEAKAIAPVEAARTVDDGTEGQGHPPDQTFAKLKTCLAEAFQNTRLGPLGPFVSGKRQEPELKKVLDIITAMENDGLVQFDSRDVQASLILKICLAYTFRFGGKGELSEGEAFEQVRGMGFTLWPADYDNDLNKTVTAQLGTQ